ncbi:MAG: bifunctional adenosylcobinamide kinase/adenosylcobinamide-phosphate guanylyltransferase [Candidatus Omnitrophota bacterium]
MGKITFILGGARSGKSNYALKIAKENGKKVAFIATCKPQDLEMKQRIRQHKKIRPAHWQTYENYKDILRLLEKIGAKFDTILIDCLTLLVSDLMLNGFKESAIKNEINKLLKMLGQINAQSIIVSNEVGLGIIPENKLAREFRDIAGRMNQIVADKADNLYFLVSGIALKIK